jgi:hypothetical protein
MMMMMMAINIELILSLSSSQDYIYIGDGKWLFVACALRTSSPISILLSSLSRRPDPELVFATLLFLYRGRARMLNDILVPLLSIQISRPIPMLFEQSSQNSFVFIQE